MEDKAKEPLKEPVKDPMAGNPATMNPPSPPAMNLHAPDKDSNPATQGGLGGPTSIAAPGVVQTTIDSKTTTIHPESTIHNRVEPDGKPFAKPEDDKDAKSKAAEKK